MTLQHGITPNTPESVTPWIDAPGTVWLDSSTGAEGERSLYGHHPDLVLQGKAGDWSLLEAELERRKASSSSGVHGAAIGYFRFDGSFRFGFYDNPQILPAGQQPDFSGTIAADSRTPFLHFHPDLERDAYLRMVERAKEYIAAGDIYQVCLAHRFRADFSGDTRALYLALRQASPAPYSAYLDLGEEIVLSSSPECFLKMDGRKIVTRPIKGTRPRMPNAEEDEQQALELKTSPKEIAELVMITDLERNDLGSICEFGSVSATQVLQLERYAQVFHLVSTVEGTLRAGISQVAAVAACFPGGSISGAPKKRALEIIQELEAGPRGLFTGAIGYFGYQGESQFNIAIRTVVIRKETGEATFHVGAGITAGSDPAKEWEETLHKAAGIFQAARGGI